jgi:hypothetical protein
MPARIRTVETYVLECQEHRDFRGTTHVRKAAEQALERHNHYFHNDPEKEETWPSSSTDNFV